MSSSNLAQSTTSIESKSRAHVVYDKTSGEILHIHHSVVFPQGVPVRESQEARALRFAGNKAGANAEVIEVDPASVNHRNSSGIRIDLAKRKVVCK
jgi:hypothetical protein